MFSSHQSSGLMTLWMAIFDKKYKHYEITVSRSSDKNIKWSLISRELQLEMKFATLRLEITEIIHILIIITTSRTSKRWGDVVSIMVIFSTYIPTIGKQIERTSQPSSHEKGFKRGQTTYITWELRNQWQEMTKPSPLPHRMVKK